MNNFKRTAIIGLATIGFISGPNTRAALTLVSGIASAGADFGSSPTESAPPTAPTTINGFYDSRDLIQHPVNSQGLQAGGWANAVWSISGGNKELIVANGSSGQGFNGAVVPGGFFYAWGHADFTLYFAIDQKYQFANLSPLLSAELVPAGGGTPIIGQNGVIDPGEYALLASTYGNAGGFSIDMQLTPVAIPESSIATPLAASLCFAGLAAKLLKRDGSRAKARH